jgi:hypothetical protein
MAAISGLKTLAEADPEMHALIEQEKIRQWSGLELIASEVCGPLASSLEFVTTPLWVLHTHTHTHTGVCLSFLYSSLKVMLARPLSLSLSVRLELYFACGDGLSGFVSHQQVR